MEAIYPVALILGLTEVVKRLGLPKKFVPAFAVVLGAGIQMLMVGVSSTSILAGVVTGLVACGLYSSTKTTIGK
jgi:hypothetical protein